VNMKLTFGFYVTIIVLFLVIVLTMCNSCSKYVPYSASSLYSNVAAYEGFRSGRGLLDNTYSTYPDNVAIDSYDRKNITQNPVAETCVKVFGFDGLQCSPSFNDNNLDMFSTANGSASCLYQGSGLSNSMGTLCLTPDMQNALRTRGMNQTSSPALVGTSAV